MIALYVNNLYYKHDAIDITVPGSMQDACHINFVIDLAHHSLCGSVVEHHSAESEELRLNCSWELKIFSLSHACATIAAFSMGIFYFHDSNLFGNLKLYVKKLDPFLKRD